MVTNSTRTSTDLKYFKLAWRRVLAPRYIYSNNSARARRGVNHCLFPLFLLFFFEVYSTLCPRRRHHHTGKNQQLASNKIQIEKQNQKTSPQTQLIAFNKKNLHPQHHKTCTGCTTTTRLQLSKCYLGPLLWTSRF